MSLDLSHLNSILPFLVESIFMSSSVAVILIDWNYRFLQTSLLRMLQSYLPQWRRRNIRQDAYLCLFGVALAIIYSNSMNNFAINTENCRIAGAAIVVLLSFWYQSKRKEGNMLDKCVGTSNGPVFNKSVGGSPVTHKDQDTSASSCCGVGIPPHPLSLSSSLKPQFEVNIEEELRRGYVKDFRKQKDEEEVTEEELVTAIQYLNTLKGGINAHRSAGKLADAVKHIQRMRQFSRLDDSGLPLDHTFEEDHNTVAEEKGPRSKDFKKLLEKCLESSSFLPSPEELMKMQHDYKGIVQLEKEVEEKEKEVEETKREVEETKREVEETKREVEEKDREIEETKREVEEKDKEIVETTEELERSLRAVDETTQVVIHSQQALQQHQQTIQQHQQTIQQHQQTIQQKDQTIQQKNQTIQQKDHMLNQKDSLLQQERQRVRELEQNPEGEWQRRLREMEEEIRRLSVQSDRSKCKICRVEEVQVSFTPCNHLISCQGCVDNLSERVCPVCREPIQGTVTMFFA